MAVGRDHLKTMDKGPQQRLPVGVMKFTVNYQSIAPTLPQYGSHVRRERDPLFHPPWMDQQRHPLGIRRP